MKNKTLYDKTIAILVKAYMNDTLRSGRCDACMVGNLINHYRPFTADERINLRDHVSGWVKVFCTINGKDQRFNMDQYTAEAKEQIDSTGYSPFELAKCENIFEMKYGSIFDKLMAVVEVLGEIHEVSQEVTEETKLMFVK